MARSRHPKKMDNLVWDGFGLASTARSAGTTSITFRAADTLPTTLLRIRGAIACYADATQAPGGLVTIGTGVIKVPEGSGATTQYDPLTDETAPWIWYSHFAIGYEEMVTDVIDVPGMTSYREVVDSKAMRRLRPDEELQWTITNSTLSGAMSVNMSFTGRFLVGF